MLDSPPPVERARTAQDRDRPIAGIPSQAGGLRTAGQLGLPRRILPVAASWQGLAAGSRCR